MVIFLIKISDYLTRGDQISFNIYALTYPFRFQSIDFQTKLNILTIKDKKFI